MTVVQNAVHVVAVGGAVVQNAVQGSPFTTPETMPGYVVGDGDVVGAGMGASAMRMLYSQRTAVAKMPPAWRAVHHVLWAVYYPFAVWPAVRRLWGAYRRMWPR